MIPLKRSREAKLNLKVDWKEDQMAITRYPEKLPFEHCQLNPQKWHYNEEIFEGKKLCYFCSNVLTSAGSDRLSYELRWGSDDKRILNYKIVMGGLKPFIHEKNDGGKPDQIRIYIFKGVMNYTAVSQSILHFSVSIMRFL